MSRRVDEFDEFEEPTTISASTRGATSLTASWRLVVAKQMSSLWGPWIAGNLALRASTMCLVSSIDRVVCVTQASA